MKKLFLIIVLFLLASPAWATDYYIATTGSDAAAGTIGAPWLTGQKCANTAVAGDTCNFRTGSYGGFSTPTNGTAGNVITFKNYMSEVVTLDATLGKVSGTSVIDVVINASNRSYLTFDGLRITGNTADSGTHTNRAHVGFETTTGSNIILKNCQVSFAWGTGVGIYVEAHDITVENCRIFENAKDNWPRQTVRDWGAGMIAFHGCYNITFKDNLIYWNHGEGVTAGDHAHEVTFDGNAVADNWQTNLYATESSQNITVKNNIVFNTDDAKNWPAPSVGYHANNPAGIQMTAGDSASSYTFAQRHITGIKIYNNVVVGAAMGILRYLIEAGHPDSDWLIANNTLLLVASAGIKIAGGLSYTDVDIRNNIVTGALSAANSDWAFFNIDIAPVSSTISHNIWNTSTTNEWIWLGTSYATYSEWAAVSGEVSSSNTSPLLTSESITLPILRDGDDTFDRTVFDNALLLTASSPAVNTGVDLSATFTVDTLDVTRPQGSAFDRGAYEKVLTPPPAGGANVNIFVPSGLR